MVARHARFASIEAARPFAVGASNNSATLSSMPNRSRRARDHLNRFVPEGTYYTFTDVSDLGWDDALQFCLALLERAGVIAVPVNGFYDHPGGRHMVRWACCKHPS